MTDGFLALPVRDLAGQDIFCISLGPDILSCSLSRGQVILGTLHMERQDRTPADEAASLQGSGLAGCSANRGLPRKGQQPWPASAALSEGAVLRGVAVLFVTELLLAISVAVSEAKSGTELGAQGSQWSMAEG